MVAGVADTHAVVWYLFGDSRLSAKARTFIDDAASATDRIGVSAITFVELVYLIEKRRLPAEVLERLLEICTTDNEVFFEVPVDQEIARALRRVERGEVPDLPDRIIAATALHLQVPLLSRDRKIVASQVETIW